MLMMASALTTVAAMDDEEEEEEEEEVGLAEADAVAVLLSPPAMVPSAASDDFFTSPGMAKVPLNKNKPWPRTPGKAAGQQARWRGTKAREEVGAVRANNTDQKQRNLTGDSCHPSVLEHGPRTKKCVTRDTYGTADQRGAERLQTRAQTRRMQGNAQTVRKVPLHIPSQKQVQRTIIRVWDTELHNQMF